MKQVKMEQPVKTACIAHWCVKAAKEGSSYCEAHAHG